MENFTKQERRILRALHVNAADVHAAGANSCGVVYRLSNNYYLTEITAYGYSRRDIYRILARKLIKQVGIIEN